MISENSVTSVSQTNFKAPSPAGEGWGGVAGGVAGYITIRGARVNNLKNIDVQIPHNKLVVITGVSGSGKSSLAFDTLYAEGQRRYVESLSTYARQFLGRLRKPECDFIEGIAPAIAIEQKVTSRNPRSTVGTSTEIYDYLRMLYARIGRTYSPISGQEVKKHTVSDIAADMLTHEPGSRLVVMTPIILRGGRTLEEQLEVYRKTGYQRVAIKPTPQQPTTPPQPSPTGEGALKFVLLTDTAALSEITTEITTGKSSTGNFSSPSPVGEGWGGVIYLVIDRLKVSDSKDTIARLADSANTALYEGDGKCLVHYADTDSISHYSLKFEADGMTFTEPTDQMFSFNSPVGACPECEGYSKVIGIDESLVIPNTALSVHDGCVACWSGDKMGEWKKEFERQAYMYDFPIFTPYHQLTQEQKDFLWHNAPVCIDAFFDMVKENQYKIQYRVMLARYRGKTTCPVCKGKRLKKEAEYVKIGGKSITDICDMSIEQLRQWFDNLQVSEHEEKMAKRLLTEIKSRLKFLDDVGLSYLTLSRMSNTLSGGESQRINLATSLGSSLVGSMYILDEPSIGLHPRDTHRLINVLRQLQQLGNTVIIVEHDEEIMRAADYIIDIGPDAGQLGGEVVWEGEPPATPPQPTTPPQPSPTGEGALMLPATDNTIDKSNFSTPSPVGEGWGGVASHTLDYLLGIETIPIPQSRRQWNNYIIIIKNARENNLKGIDVKIPLNVMTCVTGVSGSGKTSLIRTILYQGLRRHLGEASGEKPGQFSGFEGDIDMIRHVDFVDQNPIGTSSRSNPVTYIGAWEEVRKLYATQQLSKQLGFTPAYFSFNTDGGRCEECKGDGYVTVEMQFMNDITLQCEACHGRRFKSDILDVKFHGKDVSDVLDMTVNEAIDFFTKHEQKKIVGKLKPLQEVGLGYIKMGQTSSTLSGGENQRIKLASYLSQERIEPTMFIFDEPTTGLHFHDIRKLLDAFNALIARGHTIVIIEHNVEVIKCADHVIDIGPEGGDAGGNIVAQGIPEAIAQCEQSYTAKALPSALRQLKTKNSNNSKK